MPKLKKIERYPLIDNIREFFKIQSWMPIIPWVEKNITMVDDVSSESDRPDFSRYCYQLEPLKQWEDIHARKHVTVVMCEQMGKTSLFVYGILYRLIYDPGSVLVCYPGADKAVETNSTKFIPLMKKLPGLKEELLRPRVIRSDRIKLSNAVLYWQGSGSKIVSKSCSIVCGDEVDQWAPEHPQNLRDLCKRTRSYKASMEFVVCSPTVENGQIWQDFLKSSQGYFTLRCKRMWTADYEKL